MSLSSDVQARIQASRLIQLTNLTSTAASVLTQAVLDAAIADCKAEFAAYVGVAYDETNTAHTPLGVRGTLYYLCWNKGLSEEAAKLRVEWYDLMTRYAQTAGLKWFSPGSNVPYTPTTEPAGMRPDTDRARFDDVVPQAPRQWSSTRRQTPNT